MKRILCLLLVLALSLGGMTVFADDEVKTSVFYLSDASAKAGEEVTVKLSIKDNPGIICAKTALYYDRNYFSVVDSQDKKELFRSGFYMASKVEQYPYVMVWVSVAESENDGVMSEITLKVSENAPTGEYPIYIDYSEDDVCNAENINRKFTVLPATITVTGNENAKPAEPETLLPIFPEVNLFKKVGSFENFKVVNEFKSNTYSDLEADKWYVPEVTSTFEYGLMLGKGEGLFVPDANITLAEGLTLASRVFRIYLGTNGEMKSNENEPWYIPYLNYAAKKNIYTKEKYGEAFDETISREVFASLMANALPDECYEKINSVEAIPDISTDDAFYSDILKLYNAGIVTGNDDNGTFLPKNTIKRSEVAAIVNRLAVQANRKSLKK